MDHNKGGTALWIAKKLLKQLHLFFAKERYVSFFFCIRCIPSAFFAIGGLHVLWFAMQILALIFCVAKFVIVLTSGLILLLFVVVRLQLLNNKGSCFNGQILDPHHNFLPALPRQMFLEGLELVL